MTSAGSEAAGTTAAARWLGLYDKAHTHVRRALRLSEKLGDQIGQADSHIALGSVLEQQGRPEEGLPHAQRALALCGDIGYRHGQARALNNIGWYHALLGGARKALTHCQQSLSLRRELGDLRGEANTLSHIGYAHYLLGQHEQAIAYHQQSPTLKRNSATATAKPQLSATSVTPTRPQAISTRPAAPGKRLWTSSTTSV